MGRGSSSLPPSSYSDPVADNEEFVVLADEPGTIIFSLLSDASNKIDFCLDPLARFGQAANAKQLAVFFADLKKKNLQLRVITSITKDTSAALKQLIKYADVYHAEGQIASSFCIVDGSMYICHADGGEEGHPSQALLTRRPQFVRMQQYLFDSLLGRTVPAKDKLREIERGIQSEFIDTIREPSKALHLAKALIDSATFDVLILFSTINSFYRAEKDGILDLLGEASGRGAAVKVLVKVDDETMKDTYKQKIKQKHDRINVAFIEKAVKSKITTLVIDQTYSLAIEVSDDAKSTFSDATGLATYSNSESTVFTYYSMFENLWIQAELERQSKVRNAYFHMFKGQKLRDEIYRRDWKTDADNK
ncbi:hypothetical protein NTE_01124 [Candidatus Nitrososphaera evergladensis SR1]|uniref:Uncharacterized protein n=1 Tax=Candidatus Nitrososphaera evergladensis SR1 TaxID=1459636 RepID=A0A075MQQ8_9ARCH|nr:hypothetical protein [Candidatus Nitrososphaera evergladensis]AIF83197.1 hypothetical protein NTE_01124 [Candidatus Nitrososphaera evergladensis SR1]